MRYLAEPRTFRNLLDISLEALNVTTTTIPPLVYHLDESNSNND